MARKNEIVFRVKADTKEFKSSMEALDSAIVNLKSKTANIDLSNMSGLDSAQKKLVEARQGAESLRTALEQAAVVTKDGKFIDLSNFNAELGKSGKSLGQIGNTMASTGAQGKQAFENVALELMKVESKVKKTNVAVQKMKDSLTNTIRWSISSSLLNNFTGSVQKAIKYTSNLDQKLTDIRIVSGQSAEQMQNFAKQANAAAAALNSTTLRYTEASLIFFQQGLNNSEVIERTNVTIKMANVLGESVSDVSSYMTAIWNNFDRGSKSIEYFGDVITALGAKTAASSEEIATGLEKFAAVAEASGLSYEYATSALATVVSTTRQSADTVGTAFKTIFARIQGLSLGETLEDGTSLNKYSTALYQVGVNIKDSNGNLKSMDAILEELGAKWGTIAQDQKLALAQTVAGTRQYNQLVALMDNWDFMKENLETAKQSMGELDKQNKIYAESLEAHTNKLQTSFEKLVSTFADSSSFKVAIDMLTGLLNVVEGFTKAIGGGGTALMLFGTILSKVFSDKVGKGITNTVNGVKDLSKVSKELFSKQKKEAPGVHEDLMGYKGNDIQEVNKKYRGYINSKSIGAEETNAYIEALEAKDRTAERVAELEKAKSERRARLDSAGYGDPEIDPIYEISEKYNKEVEGPNKENDNKNQLKLNLDNAEKNLAVKRKAEEDAERKLLLAQTAPTEGNKYLKQLHANGVIKARQALADALNERQEAEGNVETAQSEFNKVEYVKVPTKNEYIAKVTGGVYTSEKELSNDAYKSDEDLEKAQQEALQAEAAAKNKQDELDAKTKSEALGNLASSFIGVATAAGMAVGAMDRFAEGDFAGGIAGLISTVLMGIPAISSFAAALQAMGIASNMALGPLGWIVGGITALVAVVSLVTKVAANNTAEKKTERALEAHEKKLKALGVAADEAKAKIQELQDTFNQYTVAKNGLDDLVRGTLEWQQALEDTNEKAQDLIDKFGLIEGSDYTVVDGIITIKEDAIKKAEADAFTRKAELEAVEEKEKSKRYVIENKYKYNETLGDVETSAEAMTYYDENGANRGESYYTAEQYAKDKKIVEDGKAFIKKYEEAESTLRGAADVGVLTEDQKSAALKKATDKNGNIDYEAYQNYLTLMAKTAGAAYGEFAKDNPNKAGNSTEYFKTLQSQGLDIKNANNLVDKDIAKLYAVMTGGYSIDQANKVVKKDGKWYIGEEEIGVTDDNKGTIESLIRTMGESKDVSTWDDNTLVAKGATGLQEARGNINSFLSGKGNELTKDLAGALGSGSTSQLSSFFSTHFSPDQMANIDETVNQLVASMGLREAKQLYAMAGMDENTFKGIMRKYDKTAYYQSQVETSKSAISNIDGLYSDISNGDITSENIGEDSRYTTLLNNISNIRDKSEELAKAEEVLKDKRLVGTEAYNEALRVSQEELDKIYAKGQYELSLELGEDVKKSFNDLDKLEEKLNSFLDKQYEIDIKIHADADNAFTDMENRMSKLEQSASKIGDGYIVAQEDIRSLGEMFPGILNQAEYLSDGTIKLNEKMAKSAIDLAKDEIEADTQATITELENQKNVLKTKQQAYLNLAKAYEQMSKSNVASEEDKKAVIDAINTINAQNANLNLQNQKTVADDSNTNAKIVAENWTSGYEQALNASAEFAKTALEDQKAVADNNQFYKPATQRKIGVNYQGKGGIGSTVETNLATVNDRMVNGAKIEKEEFKEAAEAAAKQAELVQPLLDDIDAMIVSTNAAKFRNLDILSKIGSGLGADGKKSDDMDLLEDVADKYHDINIEIEKTVKTLDKLKLAREKAIGTEYIENLDEQIEAIKKQNELYSKKIALQKEDAELARKTLEQHGFQFNEDGSMSNYYNMLQEKQDEVNAIIEKYNGMSKTEQESYSDAVESAKTQLDVIKKAIEEYDNYFYNEMPELEKQTLENLYTTIELQSEKFNLRFQVRLDMEEAIKEYNEFRRDVVDNIASDDYGKLSSEALVDMQRYYTSNNDGVIQNSTERVNSILTELKKIDEGGHSDVYSTFNEDTGEWVHDRKGALEDLKEAEKGLMDFMREYKQLSEEIDNNYFSAIEKVSEAFADQLEVLEVVNKQLSFNINLTKILYGDKAYAQMTKFYSAQRQNAERVMNQSKSNAEYWSKKMNEALASGDEKSYEVYKDKTLAAIEQMNGSIEAFANSIVSEYENSIDSIIDDLNDKITNGLGLEYVKKELEGIQENAENYLDAVDSAYGIQKLGNKWQDAINNSSSVVVQQKLNTLMNKQLEMLEKKGKLSKYDLERAEKEYDLELKKIALAEAQQNKSQMRLRRDANGNYTYQYVADDSAVSKAQQEVADAQNNLYNFDKDTYNKNLQDSLSAWEEYQKEIAEINKKYANDEEERKRLLELANAEYEQRIAALAEQNITIRNNLQNSAFESYASLYELDAQKVADMTVAERDSLMETLVPAWTSSAQQMAFAFSNTEDGGLEGLVKTALGNMEIATQNYNSEMEKVKTTIDATNKLVADNQKAIEDKAAAVATASAQEVEDIQAIRTAVSELSIEWGNAKTNAAAAAEEAHKYRLQELADQDAALKKIKEVAPQIKAQVDSIGESYQHIIDMGPELAKMTVNPPSISSNDNKDTNAKKFKVYFYDDAGMAEKETTINAKDLAEAYKIANNQLNAYIHSDNESMISSMGLEYVDDLGKTQLKKYDTGGYTGDWSGTDGRIAMLHKKELVLNEQDTANMLSAIDIVRNISSSLSHGFLSKIGKLLDRAEIGSMYNNMQLQTAGGEPIQQNVHIEATFTDATTASEIEEAFAQLTNRATQFAFRDQK